MYNSKLFNILSSFDDVLWKECKSTLKDKFRPESNEWLLFTEIYKRKKNLNHPRLSKDTLTLRFCGEGKSSAFKSLANRLLKAIEEVIVVNQFVKDEDDWSRKWHLLKFYKNKGLVKAFSSEARQMLKSLQSINNYDIDKDLKKFQLEKELLYSNISQGGKTPIFPSARQSLESFYAHSSLFLELEELNLKSLNKTEIVAHISDNSDHLELFLSNVKKMNHRKDEEAYLVVKETLLENYNNFDSVLAHTSLIYLINYCFPKIRAGEEDKQVELFSLFDFGLSSKVLLSNGKLMESTYLNIIEYKAKYRPHENHDWFIEKWLPQTETLYPDTLDLLSRALIYFAKDKHDNVLKLISDHDYRRNEIHLGFRFKWMELCSSYSAGFTDRLLDKLLDNSKRYFYRKRTKVNEQVFKSSLNLVTLIEMLCTNVPVKEIETYFAENALIMRIWAETEINKNAGSSVPA